MKISVIVPFWNSEKWLGRCLESLKTQDGDFEFIIVDDKSTDNGREIAYEYCDHDKRFTLITNHRTKGVSGARNTGIDYASGEWVTFLDADDELMPNAYNTFCSVIAGSDRANIHQLNHARYYTVIDKLVVKYTNESGIYDFGKLPQAWYGVWNKLFRREVLKGIRFDETLQYGEDGLFVLEALLKDDFIHHGDLKQIATKHRFDNPESLSHVKSAEDIHKQLQVYDQMYMRMKTKTQRKVMAYLISELWGVRLMKAIENE